MTFLVREHEGALLAYARQLTKNHHLAEDVLQEVLIRAWQHREDLLGRPGSVRGWLLTVTRNVIIDHERARRRRPVEPLHDDHPAPPAPDPTGTVLDAIVVDQVLDRLLPSLQDVVRHLYFADLSMTQTAAALGLPVGTVKSRSHHAMRTLREALLDGRASAA